MIKNSEKTLYTALVPYQAEREQREFGFMPDNLPIFQRMPVATEIVWENSEKWLNQMYKAVINCNLPNYQGARIPVPSGLNIPMWRYIYSCRLRSPYYRGLFAIWFSYKYRFRNI